MTATAIPHASDDVILGVSTAHLCSCGDLDPDDASNTPSGAVSVILDDELVAFYEHHRARQISPDGHDELWMLVHRLVDFGVKLGAAVAIDPPAEAQANAARLLDELRRDLSIEPTSAGEEGGA